PATMQSESVGLNIAAQKTEIVLLSSRKAVESLYITVGGIQLESARSLKYLGVMIDHRLNFRDHVQYASRKAAMSTAALSRLMPNVGGPRMPARKLLVSVAKATLLYAAPIWSRATVKPSYLKEARATYRAMALRLIRGFRTISEDAGLVLAGMLPVDLEIKALTEIREGVNRTTAYERQLEEWQRRWQASRKGRWTYELLPDIATWIKCQHKELDCHLTQFLTDHGCFRGYLQRFNHVDTPYCFYYINDEETAEHVLLHCPRFTNEREQICRLVGPTISPRGLLAAMMADEESWKTGQTLIVNIMKQVRADEIAIHI
ncbi:hypothetical protein KR215_008677, partial [Drosophila sulfurigaster]